MKKATTSNLVQMLMFTLGIMLMCSCEPVAPTYTYRVHYRTDMNHSELTNSIEYLPNGGVRYTNHFGRKIERFGTFSVEKLK